MALRRHLLTIALALGWGVCVFAQDNSGAFRSPLLGYYEAGILCAIDTGQSREAPDTVAGSTHVVDQAPPFISDGSQVPAVLGVGFGVRAGMAGDFAQEGVVMTITHPPLAGSGATQQSFVARIGPDTDPSVTFYQFDHGYELVTGDWTMSASAGGVLLYEVSFTVVPPAALPDLAGACGNLDLLS